ncbi:MAG: penicillin-binding protein 2 [Betaproteobacteria bacterium RIFCSPLOWO2_02_FULL_65_24]|nr:MAG: penicillin-binding protein 2 [Betaproteobacteria bacterium RIFCSPLOWO2_02_FULL_65_24]OGA77652.1 MAG: penicillin-binding protein 2 [Betaproteobacteria bacterium RIFCSPLOWO2_12_FULL_66_14]
MYQIRNTERELYLFQLRIGFAGVVVLATFAVLLARFVYLQVLQHDYYQTKAEDNRISIVPITPNRGNIVDRNGVVLARNYSAYTLEIAPSKIRDIEGTIDALEELVEIRQSDRTRFRRLVIEAKGAESLPIRTRLTDEEVAKFAANRYRFPGVEIKARLFRQYPHGDAASHVLGYIGRISERDLEKIKQDEEQAANYKGTDHIGKTGVEQSYERELHGITGYEQVEVDAGGRGVRTLSHTAPTSGNNLGLTVDVALQQIAEAAFGERRGALVAIEPSTGGILALVSRPGYDPNLFVDGIDPANWDALNTSLDRPLNNRALTGVYPPGSTFKPYMALAALELGKRTPTQTISDPGYFVFGGRQFRDSKKGGHGVVDMYKSIVVSSDTYYYMLANDLGIRNISSFIGQFGFGSRTGIDMEGEAVGVLPSEEWKKRRFRRPEQQKWYAGETISIGIGQGYNAYTPLQLAHAMATLANDGVMYRPHLVRYVENSKTGERRYIEPQPMKTIALKPQNVEFIKKAMGGVNIAGTGARAFAKAEYTSGGKTGTAQVIAIKQNEKYVESRVAERLRDHALFIAFAPLESPKIALAVLVENAGFGARYAAPIARQVLDYYLLGKKPADPAPAPAAAAAPATPYNEDNAHD